MYIKGINWEQNGWHKAAITSTIFDKCYQHPSSNNKNNGNNNLYLQTGSFKSLKVDNLNVQKMESSTIQILQPQKVPLSLTVL